MVAVVVLDIDRSDRCSDFLDFGITLRRPAIAESCCRRDDVNGPIHVAGILDIPSGDFMVELALKRLFEKFDPRYTAGILWGLAG